VICVLAILASILFPIFISARRAAARTGCQSNLKQLGAAFELYAADWDGVLPSPGGLVGDLNYWAQNGEGGLDTYLKCKGLGTNSVWCCPSFDDEWESQHVPRTYGMNTYLRSPLPELLNWPWYLIITIRTGIPKDQIAYASDTILLYEGIPEDDTNTHGTGYVGRCGDWTMVRGYAPRLHYKDSEKPWHMGRNNYLMADGHVVCREPERYPDFLGPTCPEDNLWYVKRFR
jgi:prepilin-type processing-associated H-X9-DG protein